MSDSESYVSSGDEEKRTSNFDDVVTSLMQYVDAEIQRSYAAMYKNIGRYIKDLNERVTQLEDTSHTNTAPRATQKTPKRSPPGFFDFAENFPNEKNKT